MSRALAILAAAAVLVFASAALGEEAVRSDPRPEPPSGVACVVYGRGTGLGDSCERRLTQVVTARAGGSSLARFEADGVDVAWGIYAGRGRGWVHVEDDTFVLDGFADLAKELFALRREVAVVDEHVWLKQGIVIHPLGADRHGVAVAVDDSLKGLATVDPHVPCEAILFDPPPRPEPAVSPAPEKETEHVFPRSRTLSLHAEPRGRLLTTLSTREEQLPLLLQVLERRSGWTRVAFETEVARFDAWSPTSQLDAEAGSIGGLGLSGCAACGIGMSSRWYSVSRKTAVRVGSRPSVVASKGLVIREGASVRIGKRVGQFVSITTSSSVVPPDGAEFWLPVDVVAGYSE